MYEWQGTGARVPRRPAEASGAYAGGAAAQTQGLAGAIRVASNLGWREVDALAVGDLVLTFDRAMQPIVEIRRFLAWADPAAVPEAFWPVILPEGALGNRCTLELLPDQGVMIESDAIEAATGDPFAVVPAQALEGLRGVYRQPPAGPVELVTLSFAQDEVIYADGGILLHCPRPLLSLRDMLDPGGGYPVLPLQDAVALADAMRAASRAGEPLDISARRVPT